VKIRKQVKETLVDDHNSFWEELAKSLTSKNRLYYLSAVLKEDPYISDIQQVSIIPDKTSIKLTILGSADVLKKAFEEN
jgi:hypothetical protein